MLPLLSESSSSVALSTEAAKNRFVSESLLRKSEDGGLSLGPEADGVSIGPVEDEVGIDDGSSALWGHTSRERLMQQDERGVDGIYLI